MKIEPESEPQSYDHRYLIGVALFNRGDFFEAHEAWEDLWSERHGDERRFVQGLIQAAVGLCHLINGNHRGAEKLRTTSKKYMAGLPEVFWGMNLQPFWNEVDGCYDRAGEVPGTIQDDWLPEIKLDPDPAMWPDVADYSGHEA